MKSFLSALMVLEHPELQQNLQVGSHNIMEKIIMMSNDTRKE